MSCLINRYRPPTLATLPVSDHCDGRHFFNPGIRPEKSGFDLLKWKATATPATWPKNAGGLVEPTFGERAGLEEMTVTFVGHATFLLQFGGLNILTDPVWSDRCSPVSWIGPKRVRPPAIAWERLPEIDLILLSHNHYDHCDIPTLLRLQGKFHPQILTGYGNKGLLEYHRIDNVREMDWWNHLEIPGKSVSITFCPAFHWSNRGGGTENTSLWGAFHLAGHGRSVYFAGDTSYAPHFKETHDRLGAVDLALLPIGAYEPRWFMKSMHMNPEEAVMAHQELHAKRSLGMHFGTWQLTDEGIDDPINALAAARQAVNLDEANFKAPTFGETEHVSI